MICLISPNTSVTLTFSSCLKPLSRAGDKPSEVAGPTYGEARRAVKRAALLAIEGTANMRHFYCL